MFANRSTGARLASPWSGVFGLTALLAAAAPGPSSRADRQVTIPAQTRLVGVLGNPLSTSDKIVGNPVEVRTTEAFWVDDVQVPAGMVLRGRITEAKGGGRVGGEAALAIRFNRLVVDGRSYPIVTEPFRVVGKSESKNSLKKVIGGTVAGGVVGAITGNTKKGLLIGAVLGSGVAVATKGGDITLVDGQQLVVRLSEPVVVNLRSPGIAYPQ